MTLAIIRILFDVGLLVLIWIVQRVVYPSFTYYTRDGLMKWHDKYTQRITFVVLPLMLGQVIVSGLQLWRIASWYTIISFVIILLLWASTFLKFVPLHHKISKGDFNKNTLTDLIRYNWIRTALWTILFLLSIVEITL
jgi:hypothetical protein